MATATADARTNSFLIQGAEGPIEVKPGDYYFNPKARCRRMMLNGLSSEARQVYACLELHTMSFRQEMAVTMEGGKKRPLTPSDIARETELTPQNTRRALVQLEEAGLAERRGTGEDSKSLQKGKIQIYSWATPREPKTQDGSRARLPFPAWFPESWSPLKSLITRLKLEVSIDEVVALDYLSEGEEIARAYQEMCETATRFVERICAGRKTGDIRERNERTEEKEPPPPPPPAPVTDSSPVEVEVEEAPPPPERTPREEPGPDPMPERSLRLASILTQAWPDLPGSPGPKLLEDIANQLRDIPYDQFARALVSARIAAKSYGMALSVARGVRDRANTEAATRQTAAANETAENIRKIEQWLADPDTPAEERPYLERELAKLRGRPT